ncbi:MAG: YceG family protein [Oscillospiraceae bacterium]
MYQYQNPQNFEAYFKPMMARRPQGVYCCRLVGYHPEVKEWIQKYYNTARKNGVIIEGGIPNPDTRHIEFYTEMMGSAFQMNESFIQASLARWLPRMSPKQRQEVALSIYQTLENLQKQGKSTGALKNTYIKFMCWLYYKFERIVNALGNNDLPKILYEKESGEVTVYELLLLSVLSHAGCDVLLLQYHGDAEYLKQDPNSQYTQILNVAGAQPFPQGFCLKQQRQEWQEESSRQRLYGTLPEIHNCTNAWIEGKGLTEFKTPPAQRGDDPNLFYNGFCRFVGVEDKQGYQSELYQFHQELKNEGRPHLIFDEKIPVPTPQETATIPRKNYGRMEDLILNLSGQIQANDTQLRRLMVKSFVDVMLEESQKKGMMISPLTNLAICLLCWLKRYQNDLFGSWRMPQVSMVICFGGTKDEKEALFLRFLARLPVDVLILMPDYQQRCYIEDALLYEKRYDQSLQLDSYPRESSDLVLGTTAYHAERELDTLMYQDTGMYRNQQYSKANSITLRTMYEEIFILWNEEARFRPNFSVIGNEVNIPVIFAKVSGVKDGDQNKYWQEVKKLMAIDLFIVTRTPLVNPLIPNPVKDQVPSMLRGSELLRERVKNSPAYQKSYGFLREEMQEHILDKMELMLNQNIIKPVEGSNLNVNIIATILTLPMDLIRKIQKFDFTKVPPKFLYVQVGERVISQEDAIVAAFLNLIGFDVVFLVPTGYQSVEKYYQKSLMEEHQTGEYIYDMRVPNLQRMAEKTQKSAAKAKQGGFFANIFNKK